MTKLFIIYNEENSVYGEVFDKDSSVSIYTRETYYSNNLHFPSCKIWSTLYF